MPKNEQGNVICINHQSEMNKNNNKMIIPVFNADETQNGMVSFKGSRTLDMYICNECSYVEFYDSAE